MAGPVGLGVVPLTLELRAARQANDTQLRLQRECGALEQKKLQANLEEKRLLDRLWDTYGLTHQAALMATRDRSPPERRLMDRRVLPGGWT